MGFAYCGVLRFLLQFTVHMPENMTQIEGLPFDKIPTGEAPVLPEEIKVPYQHSIENPDLISRKVDFRAQKRELRSYSTAEEFFPQLHKELEALNLEDLILILKAACENWVKFDPENFGFRLPERLSFNTINSLGEYTDMPDVVSVRTSFIANIATEIWLRKADQVFNFKGNRGMWGISKKTREGLDERYLRQLKQVEQLANVLLNDVIDASQLINEIQDQITKEHPHYNLDSARIIFNRDKEILRELLFDKGDLSLDQIKHFSADEDSAQRIFLALQQTLTSLNFSTKIDSILAGSKDMVNLIQLSGVLMPIFLEKIKQFLVVLNPAEDNNTLVAAA